MKRIALCVLFAVSLLMPKLSSEEIDNVRGSAEYCPMRNILLVLFIGEEIYVYCEYYGKQFDSQQIESTLIGHSVNNVSGFQLLRCRAELSQYITNGYHSSWVKKIILAIFIINVLGVIAFAWARKKDTVRNNLSIVIFFIPIVGIAIFNGFSGDGTSTYRHICVIPSVGRLLDNRNGHSRLEHIDGKGREKGGTHGIFGLGKLNNISSPVKKSRISIGAYCLKSSLAV